jgi:crotonobetainyl-CoA:carnitine CoA-transferase CaiB-like acyl-CoA transferase
MGDTALSPFRVLDLGRVLAAPLAAQYLADFGADVIKVERPGAGDEFRYALPRIKVPEGEPPADSAYFVAANRNKRSITIDLKNPAGQDLVRRLAAESDVLVENFKVGDLARSGLDYASLSKVNPRLIYCSITGYGQSGPYAARPAYDPIIQAMGGLVAVTGTPGNGDGSGPAKVGPAVIDIFTGMTAANAILAAILQRERTNEGQYIDVSLLDSGIALLSQLAVMYLSGGEVPARLGTDSNGNSPSGMFRCADGSVMVVAGNERQFKAFCVALECPELPDDPRFQTRELRIANRSALRSAVELYSEHVTVADALQRLAEANVPAGQYNEIADVFKDPQVIHRGAVVTVPHPRKPDLKLIAPAARMSASQPKLVAPPLLGADTEEILRDILGLSQSEINELRQSGAI